MLHDDIDDETNFLSKRIIGAAIEVHRRLGPGLDEALYQAALAIELRLCGIAYEKEVVVRVNYKGYPIGEKRLDFVVEQKIVVELKAVEEIHALHKAQIKTYLVLTKYRLGLLINFNVPILADGISRVVHSSNT